MGINVHVHVSTAAGPVIQHFKSQASFLLDCFNASVPIPILSAGEINCYEGVVGKVCKLVIETLTPMPGVNEALNIRCSTAY